MDSHNRDSLSTLEEEIDSALFDDDVDLFVSLTHQLPSTINAFEWGQESLMKASMYRAIRCATVLLNEETHLTFDVNRPTSRELFPIHHAAFIADPGTIELLLYHGASANNCSAFVDKDSSEYPPLLAVLHQARSHVGIFVLNSNVSIYQLVTLVCLQRCLLTLECVELLSCATENFFLDQVFWWCVGHTDFFSLAILLAVARKSFGAAITEACSPSSQRTKDLSEDEKRKLIELLDLFARRGDALEAYIREKKSVVTIMEVSNRVARLLDVDSTKTDLLSLHKCVISQTTVSRNDLLDLTVATSDTDAGMQHYGTSGHRWRLLNELDEGKTFLRPCISSRLDVPLGKKPKNY